MFGVIYFHPSLTMASAPPCSIYTERPLSDLPRKASIKFSLSVVSPAGIGYLRNAEKEASISILDTRASETRGLIFPGQLIINGIHVPSSKALYLQPRIGPACVCPLRLHPGTHNSIPARYRW